MSEVRQNIGKVAVAVKGEWSASVAYEKSDIVSANGGSYISVQAVPAGTPLTDATYWLLLAERGEQGEQGEQGTVDPQSLLDVIGLSVVDGKINITYEEE